MYHTKTQLQRCQYPCRSVEMTIVAREFDTFAIELLQLFYIATAGDYKRNFFEIETQFLSYHNLGIG